MLCIPELQHIVLCISMHAITKIKTLFYKDKIHYSLLVLVFIIAFFLRFYNFPFRYGFDGDGIRDMIVTMLGAKNWEFPLAGNFSSVGPFTFGPLFRIQLILVTILFPFIYTAFIYMGILSLIFVFLLYKIGKELGGKTVGLIAALLAAVSPDQITVATGISNPNVVPLFSAAALYCFLLLLKKDSRRLGFLLGVFLALGFDAHTQMLPLFMLPLLLIGYKIYKREKWVVQTLFTILGGVLVFIPFIIFNVLSEWHTVRGMFFYYTQGKNAIYVPNRWLFYIRDFWPEMFVGLLGIPAIVTTFLVSIVGVTTIVQIIRRRMTIGFGMVLFIFLANFVLLRFYWGERHGVYLYYLQPFILVLVSLSLGYITKIRYGIYIVALGVSVISFFALQKDIKMFDPVGTNIYFIKAKEEITKAYPNSPIELYNCENYYIYRAETVGLLLYLENKLDKGGKRIAFIDQAHICHYPRGRALPPIIINPSAELIRKIYPPLGNSGMGDFSKASEREIVKAHWKKTDVKHIFEEEVNWWKTSYRAQ